VLSTEEHTSGHSGATSGHGRLGPVVTWSLAREILTVEFVRITLNWGAMWHTSCDRMLGGVHPVIPTVVFGRCAVCCPWCPMALFRGGSYLSPMASSSSLSWPFTLT
jgi:hypothetical protein